MLNPDKDTEQDQQIEKLQEKIKQLKVECKQKRAEQLLGEKISLGYLLSHVKLSQLWTLIVIIATLISGAGAVTYSLANKKSDAQLLAENAKAEVKVSNMQLEITKYKELLLIHEKKVNFYKGLEKKEKFLGQYLNYLLSKQKCESDQLNMQTNACKVFSRNQKLFSNNIKNLWRNRHKVEDESGNGVLIGISGEMLGATVKFLYDGTYWNIPDEFVSLLID